MKDADYVGPKPFVPAREWGRWCLHRADLLHRDGTEDDNPMFPDEWEDCPDVEALFALIART